MRHAAMAGSRVLNGRYGENVLALVVAKGRDDWFPAVNKFVLNGGTSGLLRQIIHATGLASVEPVVMS